MLTLNRFLQCVSKYHSRMDDSSSEDEGSRNLSTAQKLLKVRSISDEKMKEYTQSFSRIFKDAMEILQSEMNQPTDSGHYARIFLAAKKMDCFIRRDWSRSVVDPPPFDKVPDTIVNLTAKSKQTDKKFLQANKVLEAAAAKMGRHLLDDVHKYGCLERYDCEGCEGQCPVQTSRVSSLEVGDWPTKRLIVPCVTAKTLDQPLYERVVLACVSTISLYSFGNNGLSVIIATVFR